MEIIWSTTIKLKHMNKGYGLSCWCVAIVLTCVGDPWDKLLGALEDEGGYYGCEDLHDGCRLIKRT